MRESKDSFVCGNCERLFTDNLVKLKSTIDQVGIEKGGGGEMNWLSH